MCLASKCDLRCAWAPFQNLWAMSPPASTRCFPGIRGCRRISGSRVGRPGRHATSECAWFLDQDGRLGSLEPGKHADLIVLSDDYFRVRDDAIKDIRSHLTIVGGRIVFANGAFPRLAG